MAKTPIVKDHEKGGPHVQGQDDMADCMSTLARSSFAAVPVVDEDGFVVGLLSEKDVLRTIIDWAYDQRAGGPVENYMSPLEVIGDT